MSVTEPIVNRVRKIDPWFLPIGWEAREFFRVTTPEKVGVPVVAMPNGKMNCLDHFEEEDCACRGLVRESQLLNDTAPVAQKV